MKHEWVAALLLPVSPQEAGRLANQDEANLRDRVVEVADIFCKRCRQRRDQTDRHCQPFDLLTDEAIKRARDTERLREWHRRKAEKKREADRV